MKRNSNRRINNRKTNQNVFLNFFRISMLYFKGCQLDSCEFCPSSERSLNGLTVFDLYSSTSAVHNVRSAGHIRPGASRQVALEVQQEIDYFRYISDIKTDTSRPKLTTSE